MVNTIQYSLKEVELLNSWWHSNTLPYLVVIFVPTHKKGEQKIYKELAKRLSYSNLLLGWIFSAPPPGPESPYPTDRNIQFSIPYISDLTLRM